MNNERPHPGPGSSIAGQDRRALAGELLRNATELIGSLLERMFSSCDDQFFDLASRAKIVQIQNRHFESLREIRQRKTAVIRRTLDAFAANFAVIDGMAPRRSAAAAPREHSAETLTLIPELQVERDVVVTDMVARARNEWQQEFSQLHERLLEIANAPFEEHHDPFDAGVIADCFSSAIDDIEIEIEAIKVVLRQFEQNVLGCLDELYLRVNTILIEARVLPDLAPLRKRKVRKYALPASPGKRRGHGDGTDETGHSPAGADDVATASGGTAVPSGAHPAGIAVSLPAPPLGIPISAPETRELAELLHRLREGGIRLPLFPATTQVSGAGGTLAADGGGTPITREELLALLSGVQTQPQPGPDGEHRPLDIRRAIESIAASRGQITLGTADEDIINVVAMFFDIILDDRNLPLEIQALVSRLQIPVLKVALRDRSFFTDRKNSARQFINEIARASIGWESSGTEAQDVWYQQLSALVDDILTSPDGSTEVFDRCLERLRTFVTRAEQRSAKLEKRTSEKAAADARLAAARDLVRHALQERLEGRVLPRAISDFLVGDWQQVMQLMYLKHGKESAEWLDALQTVDDLIWSVQEHTDERSHARLERLLPDLDRRMNEGLLHIKPSAEEVAARLGVVREVHRKLADAGQATVPAAPLTASQQQKIALPEESQSKSWKEMTAVERQRVQYDALMFEYLKRVDDMPIGTWLLYDDLRRGTTRRCKLAARIPDAETFVFVNRLGVNVYDKPRKAFAYDLQMGHARLIEDKPLFERTLEMISTNLRKLVGETPQEST